MPELHLHRHEETVPEDQADALRGAAEKLGGIAIHVIAKSGELYRERPAVDYLGERATYTPPPIRPHRSGQIVPDGQVHIEVEGIFDERGTPPLYDLATKIHVQQQADQAVQQAAEAPRRVAA